MKHNLTVGIDKKRREDGIVSCQQVGIREKLMPTCWARRSA
ncbi:hypothetical protein [Olegusella massiliensis]|nr:hypothetical protein [Olegusella massiliensis]